MAASYSLMSKFSIAQSPPCGINTSKQKKGAKNEGVRKLEFSISLDKRCDALLKFFVSIISMCEPFPRYTFEKNLFSKVRVAIICIVAL